MFLGILAIVLGIAFEKQNIAFMVGLAFAVAASCNFPVLAMSMFWKGTTTTGAFVGGFVGLAASVGMVIMGPAVWEGVLGNVKGSAPIIYNNPALFSMTLAFAVIWIVSLIDRSRQAAAEREAYEAQFVRSQTGIGAAGASAH